jgi:RNA polymerase sigma-70 factor (ECF subfamily)
MVAGLSELNDEELIFKIQHENASKYFKILYDRYYLKVLDKCYSFVKNKQIAGELAEDIFSKVFEKLASFKQLSSFSSWLYSITYNHCIDYLRDKKKLHYPSWNSDHELPEIVEEEEIAEEVDYDELLILLEKIHPEEKALILMKYKDDLSMKQIGAALRISEDAAKMRLKRAKARVLYLYTQKHRKQG